MLLTSTGGGHSPPSDGLSSCLLYLSGMKLLLLLIGQCRLFMLAAIIIKMANLVTVGDLGGLALNDGVGVGG